MECGLHVAVVEKQLSKRSWRRLRLQLARRLLDEGRCEPKKPRQETTYQRSTEEREDASYSYDLAMYSGNDQEQSDSELSCGEPGYGLDCQLSDREMENMDSCEQSVVASRSDHDSDLSYGDPGGSGSEYELSGGELSSSSDFDIDSLSGDINAREEVSQSATLTQTPLFPGSRISSADFNIAFMSLAQRHNLTYSSQTDILKFLSIILPSPNPQMLHHHHQLH